MFFNNSVRKGVMHIIEQRIEVAQRLHEEECHEYDLDYEEGIERLTQERDTNKEKSLSKHVNSIIGKLL